MVHALATRGGMRVIINYQITIYTSAHTHMHALVRVHLVERRDAFSTIRTISVVAHGAFARLLAK